MEVSRTARLPNLSTYTSTSAHTNTLTLLLLPLLNRLGPSSTLNLFICQTVRVYASSQSRRRTHQHRHTQDGEHLSEAKQQAFLYFKWSRLRDIRLLSIMRGDCRRSCVLGSSKTLNIFREPFCTAFFTQNSEKKGKRDSQVFRLVVLIIMCRGNLLHLWVQILKLDTIYFWRSDVHQYML